ncbi:hypothetical protein [Chromobacterium sp. IIBBL 290-4]|uniref:hypothetical protein n=1 Tax=Chromobacterium sp. IIBBL 290-4 TaxID=2953890 RepID=UPI0020B8D406|nr:hypothetical protein [Chromobacterium sp. IIBBL 290-4]UTH75875.1 hypothetical protein NKT35_07160 [Chromobacterium sp. IIBBL 290-4]
MNYYVKKVINLLLPAFILLVSNSAQAIYRPDIDFLNAYPWSRVCGKKPQIYYINGIWSPGPAAQVMAANALGKSLFLNGVPYFNVITPLHNPSEGRLLDIFRKLTLQKFGERIAAVEKARYIENLNLMGNGLKSDLSSEESNSAMSAITSSFATQSLQYDPIALNTLNSSYEWIAVSSSWGLKQIIVAHSQGNMFAQGIYSRFQADDKRFKEYHIKDHLQVVNVATPAATPDTGKYITSNRDQVINTWARALSTELHLLQPAPANFDSGFSTYLYDLSGHGFQEVYLNPSLGLEQEVIRLIKSASAAAKYRGADNYLSGNMSKFELEGSGYVTITYPNGVQEHIESNQMTPNVLSLNCNDVQTGTYHIQVTSRPYLTSTNNSQNTYRSNLKFYVEGGIGQPWLGHIGNTIDVIGPGVQEDQPVASPAPRMLGNFDFIVERDEKIDGYRTVLVKNR